jgi:hypothetical protein
LREGWAIGLCRPISTRRRQTNKQLIEKTKTSVLVMVVLRPASLQCAAHHINNANSNDAGSGVHAN